MGLLDEFKKYFPLKGEVLSEDQVVQLVGQLSSKPKPLSPGDTGPFSSGLFYPLVDGPYPHAGGLVRDTSVGGVDEGMEVKFINDGDVWTKSSYPLPIQEADGIVEPENAKAVSGGEVYDNTPRLTTGRNLFDPSKIRVDRLVSTTPAIGSAAGWACSDFIPVIAGEDYALSGNKTRVGLGFFDENKVGVRYRGINTGVETAQEGEAFVAFNLRSPAEPNWSNVQFEKGGAATPYVPFGKVVKKDQVEGLGILEDEVDSNTMSIGDIFNHIEFVNEQGLTNLLNPFIVSLGQLLGASNGNTTTAGVASDYNTTDFIPIDSGSAYRFMNIKGVECMRVYCFYNASKVFISGENVPVTTNLFTAPLGAAFVRVSFPSVLYSGLGYKPADFGLFKGAGSSWEPFFTKRVLVKDAPPTEEKEDNEVATISDIRNSGGTETQEDTFSYALSDTVISIQEGGNSLSGIVRSNRGFTGNNMFNFNSYTQSGESKSIGDDVAPMHASSTTIGANHGQPCVIATVTAHGLTNTAIGKAWVKDGITFYVMRIEDANKILFLSANQGTEVEPSYINLTEGVLLGTPNLTVTSVTSSTLR